MYNKDTYVEYVYNISLNPHNSDPFYTQEDEKKAVPDLIILRVLSNVVYFMYVLYTTI